MNLKPWSPADSALLEDHETFKRWALAGKKRVTSGSLGLSSVFRAAEMGGIYFFPFSHAFLPRDDGLCPLKM